ncbi:hypothetical protein NGG52_01655 [Mammaliicoccus sciuri]|uniref:hypothetical protein n=1 Tax=Mammaliicoccus sciuri TaxID=1296 RepID=UPI0019536CA1|nr:hypothetical protein [Mammaliicoccus sciuri]MEB8372844.1 hypothetical protein [Mammaliicoccus sciuri]
MNNYELNENTKHLLQSYSGRVLNSPTQIQDFITRILNNGDILNLNYPDFGWNEIKSIKSQEGFLIIEDPSKIHLLNVKNFYINKLMVEDLESWYFFIETNASTTNIERPINQLDYRYSPFQYWSDCIEEKLLHSEYSDEDIFEYDPETEEEILVSQVYDLYAKPLNGESFIITFNVSLAGDAIEKINKYPMNYSNQEYRNLTKL